MDHQQLKPSQLKPWMDKFPKHLPSVQETRYSVNGFLWRRNAQNLGDVALEYFGNEITFGELHERVWQTAKALLELGVRPGEIVTVCSVMIPESVYLFYAMDLIGAVGNMVDPRSSTDGIHDYIAEVDSKIVITLNVAYPKIQKAVIGTATNRVIVMSPADSLKGLKRTAYKLGNKDKNDYDDNVLMWQDFYAMGAEAKHTLNMDNYDPKHPCIILHTGGTTGTPKCVMLPTHAINAIALQYSVNAYERSQKFLSVMPPFIAYGFICGIHTPLCQGVRCILIPSFEASELGDLLMKHKPNHMAGAPAHYQELIKHPKTQKADLSFLKTAGCGGDSMSTGAEERVIAFLDAHNCPNSLAKGYGMTEFASTATTNMGRYSKIGSIGFPLFLVDLGIFKPGTDEELGFNEEGEICFTGPNMMLGYYGNPEETAKTMVKHSDGRTWIHSGDIGVIDEEGYVFLRSRIKRVVIRHDGFKVYVTSIENEISKHPNVDCCSVVAVKDLVHTQGQYPFAFIKWRDTNADVIRRSMAEVKALCHKRLAEYVEPKGFASVKDMPYTGNSKVDYRKLEVYADQIWQKTAQQQD